MAIAAGFDASPVMPRRRYPLNNVECQSKQSRQRAALRSYRTVYCNELRHRGFHGSSMNFPINKRDLLGLKLLGSNQGFVYYVNTSIWTSAFSGMKEGGNKVASWMYDMAIEKWVFLRRLIDEAHWISYGRERRQSLRRIRKKQKKGWEI